MEEQLKQKLQELQKQLGKKQMFEESVSFIRSFLLQYYPSASPSLLLYGCMSATILKTTYTLPGFWNVGLGLFLEAERLVSESSEKKHLQSCITQAQEQLAEVENESRNSTSTENTGFLFEGHLTVDREPEQPDWLVRSNLLSGAATLVYRDVLQELVSRLDHMIPEILDDGPAALRVPPASKNVVANLPVSTITEELLTKLGAGAECAICREVLVVNDKMQELPCTHMFHPPCLKP